MTFGQAESSSRRPTPVRTGDCVAQWLRCIAIVPIICACSSPEITKEFTSADIVSQNKTDQITAALQSEPVHGKVSLEEAMARALKYNLDRRVRLLEEALASNQLEVSKLDRLPALLARSGYTSRDNDRIARSRDSATGEPSTSRFISQDRSHVVTDLGISWSLIDFGLGYYNTLQQSERLRVAMQKRRKAMHLLMQDVRVAFWKAASAQKLHTQVVAAIKAADEALSDAQKVEAARLRNPADTLRYQRQLLENLRLLEGIKEELGAAQVELALLINAPQGQLIEVIEPQWENSSDRALKVNVEKLEEIAVENNPDLLEQHLNARVARIEVRKTLVKLFPNVRLSYSTNYDTDSYQVNNQWKEVGLQLSLNLLNALTADRQKKLAEAGVTLADQRRVTTHMAVIAQVHLARLALINATTQFRRAEAIWDTDKKLAENISRREAAQTHSRLEKISSETAAILSLLRRYQAMAQAQTAEARLEATLGIDPAIDGVDDLSLAELTRQLQGAPRWDTIN